MKTNVEKVLERDQKLSELDDRAGKISLSIVTHCKFERISKKRMCL